MGLEKPLPSLSVGDVIDADALRRALTALAQESPKAARCARKAWA